MDMPQVISAARAEAERMRAAIAGAEETAKVNMDVRQFSQLAELIAALCDLASGPRAAASRKQPVTPRNKERPMEANNSMQRPRTLAQIESDMVTAEEAYAEAEERFKQAQLDRDAALAAINQHQSELDEAITRLRDRSPAASLWQGKSDGAAAVLMLEHEESSQAEADLIGNAADTAPPLSGKAATSGAASAKSPADDALKVAWEQHRSGSGG